MRLYDGANLYLEVLKVAKDRGGITDSARRFMGLAYQIMDRFQGCITIQDAIVLAFLSQTENGEETND